MPNRGMYVRRPPTQKGMTMSEKRALAVDPYAHQPEGEWKLQRLQDDNEMLCRVLKMESEAVFDASAKYEGREEALFRFLFAMRFLDRVTSVELKDEASTLKVLSAIFAIEGIAPSDLGNRERFVQFLMRYMDQNGKRTLLQSYLFTPAYPLGGETGRERHLMFDAASKDEAFRKETFWDALPEYCGTDQYSSCFCSRWLVGQPERVLDDFTRLFGERLYAMRCAVVHDATPVVFGGIRDQKPDDAGFWSFSVWDAYSVQGGQFVTYETRLLVGDTVGILMEGIRRCFEDGSRF